uniref:Uncharacterized protein n=1 Tax=Nomascus leucogenys TaxID=61853 RepID=A0A2I3H476_NOMLE
IFINSLASPLTIFCFALPAQALLTIFYFRIFIFIFHSWILGYEHQHSKMVPAYRMRSPRALPGTYLYVWPYK